VGARKNKPPKDDDKELRGTVLEVLKVLLSEHRDDAILELVTKLVARNEELEKLLARIRASKNKGEKVSREQLKELLGKLAGHPPDDEELRKANEALTNATAEHAGRPQQPPPPKQPPVRRPAPPGLRRVENLILVPPEERPCPKCGEERKTVGFDVREVVEVIPAEAIVRLDRREVLACGKCEGEFARAPMGDKVVAGGAYGSRLVGSLVVDKYWHGLPLARIGQDLQMLGLSMPSSSMSDQIMWATELLQPTDLASADRRSARLHDHAHRRHEHPGARQGNGIPGQPRRAVGLCRRQGMRRVPVCVDRQEGGPTKRRSRSRGIPRASERLRGGGRRQHLRQELQVGTSHRGRLQHARQATLRAGAGGQG